MTTSSATGSTTAGRVGFFVLGAVAALASLVLGIFLYLRFGHPPVATADAPFPMEAKIVHIPLNARIEREMKSAPFQADASVLQAGAQTYVKECASCHGTPGHDVAYATGMYPHPPQLWKTHGHGVVGVSDDEVGETYWKIENGIRLSGMPSYDKVLTAEQMWQVAWLMKDADKPLTPQVQATLESVPHS